MGRQALTELREMLGVLRSGDGRGARERAAVPLVVVAAAAAAAASRAVDDEGVGEGPCLSDVDELLGQSAAAGMAVDLSVEGETRSYAAEIEQTAYRVVQEALTNVHKHAAGAKTHVRLAHRVSEIAMQVENEPPPELASASAARLPSGGTGWWGCGSGCSRWAGFLFPGPRMPGVSGVCGDSGGLSLGCRCVCPVGGCLCVVACGALGAAPRRGCPSSDRRGGVS